VSNTESFASVKRRLGEAEGRLVAELGLEPDETPVRLALIRMARQQKLPESRAALTWYAAYAAYRDWQEDADRTMI